MDVMIIVIIMFLFAVGIGIGILNSEWRDRGFELIH